MNDTTRPPRPRDLAPVILGVAALLSPHVILALGLAFAAGGIRLVAKDVSRLERGALAVGLAGLGIATWLTAYWLSSLAVTQPPM